MVDGKQQYQLMLKAFYGKIQKINSDFKLSDVDKLIKGFGNQLCNDQMIIDYAKFVDDENYFNMLCSYCTTLALKQAGEIRSQFRERAKTEVRKPDVTSNDNTLIPDGWKVIDGGQK